MPFNPRWLIGRTITAVDMRSRPDPTHGKAHDPLITLDNGARLTFQVQETEDLMYGIEIGYWKQEK